MTVVINIRLKRIRQLMIGIFAILSLSVSALAACACSHHEQPDAEPEKSCHGKPVRKQGHHVGQADRQSSFGESCYCFQAASKDSVKAEGFKLKKHVSAFAAGFVLEDGKYDSITATVPVRTHPIPLSELLSTSLFSRGPPAS